MKRWEDERAELLAHLIDEGVEMAKDPLKIGDCVRIKPVMKDCPEFHGLTGTFVKLDEHASDGDAYGVNLYHSSHITYFWREELEIIECEEA